MQVDVLCCLLSGFFHWVGTWLVGLLENGQLSFVFFKLSPRQTQLLPQLIDLSNQSHVLLQSQQSLLEYKTVLRSALQEECCVRHVGESWETVSAQEISSYQLTSDLMIYLHDLDIDFLVFFSRFGQPRFKTSNSLLQVITLATKHPLNFIVNTTVLHLWNTHIQLERNPAL